MNDRELLEMAARTAGIESLGYSQNGIVVDMSDPCFIGYWNPLSDDGDALRLAVMLSMSVFAGGLRCVSVSAWITCATFAAPINLTEQYVGDDKYAATRRAIVRAAAEIGQRPE